MYTCLAPEENAFSLLYARRGRRFFRAICAYPNFFSSIGGITRFLAIMMNGPLDAMAMWGPEGSEHLVCAVQKV